MKLIDKLNFPEDLKKLNGNDYNVLSSEIREFLIDSVSKTGGHLASNLGVVELTLSLFKAFNFDSDKIVWDVGHQSYVYKILTGRKDKFTKLRQFEGMSGFPKRNESKYDYFDTGHSSTSISAALGIQLMCILCTITKIFESPECDALHMLQMYRGDSEKNRFAFPPTTPVKSGKGRIKLF